MQKSTGELLEILKRTTSFTAYAEQTSTELIEKLPLHQCLNDILAQKNLAKSDVILRSGLARSYGYDIFSGVKLPSRDKLLTLLFALELSSDEVQKLLKTTGYPPLYPRIERDSAILFGLQKKLSITDMNELLYELHYPLLE